MQLKTFGAWAGTIGSIGAGALTQSPAYSFLALPLAVTSGLVLLGLFAVFGFRNRSEIFNRIGLRGKMILGLLLLFGGCALGVVGLSIIAAGDDRSPSPLKVSITPPSTPSPGSLFDFSEPTLGDRDIGQFTQEEKKNFVYRLNAEVRPLISQVMIVRSSVTPYSHNLSVMAGLFDGAGITNTTGVRRPEGPSQTGLMIGVFDPETPPPSAQKIKKIFLQSGIPTQYYKLGINDQYMGDFNIFIGSKPW
jgi:hypothetical protein